MSGKSSPLRSSVLTLMQPLATGLAAIIGFATLTIAMRQGQLVDIASYSAGVALAAIVSALVGGGTTLAFTAGSIDIQRAVRKVRNSIVLPSILASTGLALFIYAVFGSLDSGAVVAGGLSTAANVSAELDGSYLRRRLETVKILAADLPSRGLGLIVVICGLDFSTAMLVGAVSRAVLLMYFARFDPSRGWNFPLRRAELRMAYERKLTGLSISYVLIDRVGALAVPFTATPTVAGGFSSVLSAQQSLSGVMMSGVQTLLAVRSETQANLRWAQRLEVAFVMFAAIVAILAISFQSLIFDFLGLADEAQPRAYFAAIVMLVPLAIASRILDFRAIANKVARPAVLGRLGATLLIAVGGMASVLLGNVSILAWSLVGGEVLSIVFSVMVIFWRARIHEGVAGGD